MDLKSDCNGPLSSPESRNMHKMVRPVETKKLRRHNQTKSVSLPIRTSRELYTSEQPIGGGRGKQFPRAMTNCF